MKKAEIILVVVFVLAVILKAMFLPLANILLLLSSLSLGLVYMVGGSKIFAYTNTEEDRIENNERVSTIAGYAMAIGCVGVLFTLLNWPGARVQVMVGFAATAVMFVITAWLYIKTEEQQRYYKKLAGRLTVFVIVCGTLFLSDPVVIFSFFHRNDPDYVEVYTNYMLNPGDTTAGNTYFHYLDQKK